MTRAAGLLLLLVTWAAFTAACWLAPPAGDDWLALLRAEEQGLWGALVEVARAGGSLGELYHQLAAVARPVHVIVSPLLLLALGAGAVALLLGRLPDPRRAEVAAAGVVIIAALWIGCPRLGFVCTQPASIGEQVLPLAAALWLFVPVRLGRERVAAAAILGFLAGAGARPVATVTLAAATWLLARRRSPARVAALAGVALATICFWVSPSRLSIGKAHAWVIFMSQTGELLLWIGLGLLGALVERRLRSGAGTDGAGPAAEEIGLLGWLSLAGVGGIACMTVYPRWDAVTMFPPIALLAIAGAGALLLAAGAVTRRFLVGGAALLHVAVLLVGLGELRVAARAHQRREAALAAAPAGAVVTAAPRSPIAGGFFAPGEDLADAALRERVASQLHGAADLVLEPRFRDYQPSPQLSFEIAGEGPDVAPESLGRSPGEALRRFRALARDWPPGVTAELRGAGLTLARARDGAVEIALWELR